MHSLTQAPKKMFCSTLITARFMFGSHTVFNCEEVMKPYLQTCLLKLSSQHFKDKTCSRICEKLFWFFLLLRAQGRRKSLRLRRGCLWSVSLYHCHANAVGRFWWSSKRGYVVRAGSTTPLNLHFSRRHQGRMGGLLNFIWKSSCGSRGGGPLGRISVYSVNRRSKEQAFAFFSTGKDIF